MKKYQVIYADPPWSFRGYDLKKEARYVGNKYQVQDLEWIKSLPVSDISADDCVLFLWVTMPKLNEVFQVIESWGFEYKTCAFVWAKKNKKSDSWFWGMGRWTRANPELCLLATKGNPKRVSASVHSLVVDRIGAHSKKPDQVRDKIVELIGNVPRIELFAREKTPGWDVWGNEVDSDIELLKEKS